MKKLTSVARHDLRRHLLEPANLFFMILMPLGFTIFFGMFTGGGGPESVRVSMPVVDEDRSILSSAFLSQLEGDNFEVEVHSHRDSLPEDFARWLGIPAGFQDSVLAARKVSLGLHTDDSGSASYDVAAQIRLELARARFLGNLMRWGAIGSPEATQPVRMGELLAFVGEAPRISSRSAYAGSGRPVPSGFGQSVPGMLTMFVVMTVIITGSEALTKEREEGTLRRLSTAPIRRSEILGGKLLALALLGLVQALILVAMSEILGQFGLLGMEPLFRSSLPGLAVLLVPYVFCVAAVGLLMGALFKSNQQSQSFAWLVGLIFSALGGCWWPLEIVPEHVRTLGHLFPTAWAMDGLHRLLSFGDGITGVLPMATVLILYGVVAFFLAERKLARQ